MADLRFSPSELAEVAALCNEMDPATHEITRPYIEAIDPRLRGRVVTYLRACLRAELLAGLMLRAVCESARSLGLADDETADRVLLEDSDARTRAGRASRLWTFDLGYTHPEANSLEAMLGEGRDAFAALLDLACARFFPDELDLWHRRQIGSDL